MPIGSVQNRVEFLNFSQLGAALRPGIAERKPLLAYKWGEFGLVKWLFLKMFGRFEFVNTGAGQVYEISKVSLAKYMWGIRNVLRDVSLEDDGITRNVKAIYESIKNNSPDNKALKEAILNLNAAETQQLFDILESEDNVLNALLTDKDINCCSREEAEGLLNKFKFVSSKCGVIVSLDLLQTCMERSATTRGQYIIHGKLMFRSLNDPSNIRLHGEAPCYSKVMLEKFMAVHIKCSGV